MTQWQPYDEYSTLDAPEHLLNVLHYFFTSDSNAYKYTKAKQKYNEICNNDNLATERKVFDITTGTNLVTNKTVTTYKSTQGQRYLIRKDYYQNAQRLQRNTKRSKSKAPSTPRPSQKSSTQKHSPKKSPFLQAINDLQDTSDDDSKQDDDENKSISTTQSPALLSETVRTPKMANVQSTDADDESIRSDVQQHASDLEHNMDRALMDLKSNDDDDNNKSENITKIIDDAITIKLNPILDRLQQRESTLQQQSSSLKTLSSELETLLHSTKKDS